MRRARVRLESERVIGDPRQMELNLMAVDDE